VQQVQVSVIKKIHQFSKIEEEKKMKLPELKKKFTKKYVIRIIAGVLVVGMVGTGVSTANVFAAKTAQESTESTESTEKDSKKSDTKDSDAESKLKDALDDSIKFSEKEIGKEETVYVLADSTGKERKVIVSDHLINDGNKDTIEDASDLKDIENVKGDETFKQDGSKLTWQADGNDIYYQGTSTKETPVSQTITYSLDGKEVKPEELAGKSGKVTIRFDYTNNETVKTKIDGKEEEIYVPFAAISGMVLDDSFSNVKVTNGKVISDGKNNIVVGYALPGLKESLDVDDSDFDGDVSIPDYVEVTADVENFSLSTTMTVVMNATNFISKDGDADLSEVDDMLDTLTDATDQLKDGSGELADGVDTLKSKMGEFKDGVGTLKNGIKDYTDGASTLSTGIGTLKSGVDTLAGSVPTLISGVGTLKDGSASAAKGASSLKDGAGTLKKGAKDVSTGANTLSNGVKDLSTGANTLSGGASDLSTGADTLSAGATSLSDGANTLSSGAASLNDGVQSIATNMKTLVSGTQSVSDGAAQLNTGVGTLIGTLNKMGTDLAETKASIGEISEDTANNAVLQYASLQNALIQGIVAETKGDTTAANDIYAQVVSQIGGTIGVDSISDVAGASAAIQKISSLISQTSLKVGEGVGMIGVIDTVSRKLTEPDTQEQITKLQQGAASLAEGAGKVAQGASQLSTGADAAAAGSAQVAQGAADLATGAGTLKTGAADLATGAGTLKKGASDLATGATKLKKGAGDLATGAGKVADGASTLHKGASDLSDGLNTLDGGIGQLKEKAGSLSTGADQLKSGTDQLATGASTLVSNNQKLNDGAGTLSDGTDAIMDGVGELSDGAHQLADGITEFSEDGIDEIINSYNGDIEPLIDRIQAVLDAGADYQTYTDIADGVNGSVKFIIKTDAVKAED
jgi:putative transmembrane protein